MNPSRFYLTLCIMLTAMFVNACKTIPTTTSQLEQARNSYVAAQNDPNVATYARTELKEADEAFNRANAAAINHESTDEIDNLAYVAERKIELTQEVGKQKAAEAQVAGAAKERDEILLALRTKEADQAKQSAALSQETANAAQIETQQEQIRSAQLAAELANLAAKKTERGMVVTLGDVLFGTGKAELNPKGMNTAQKLADVLKKNPERTVLIEGHTDNRGSPAHNRELSERRAAAVRDALVSMGIDANRVTIHGYGADSPVAPNNTAENRQLNRRVEIILSDENGKIS